MLRVFKNNFSIFSGCREHFFVAEASYKLAIDSDPGREINAYMACSFDGLWCSDDGIIPITVIT
jgi:hypothetical protein